MKTILKIAGTLQYLHSHVLRKSLKKTSNLPAFKLFLNHLNAQTCVDFICLIHSSVMSIKYNIYIYCSCELFLKKTNSTRALFALYTGPTTIEQFSPQIASCNGCKHDRLTSGDLLSNDPRAVGSVSISEAGSSLIEGA